MADSSPSPDEIRSELESIFELTVVGLAHIKDRAITRCNRQMEEMFGFGPGEMLGCSTRVWYRNDEEFKVLGGSAYPDLAAGRSHSREQYFRRKDGSEFWGRIAGRAPDPAAPFDCVLLIEDATERHEAAAALARYQQELEHRVLVRTAELAEANERLQAEIEERRQAEQRVWHVANHDALTTLPNRSLFHDRLNQALAQAKRRGEKVALVFVDLDRFKSINDTLGHHVGDELLKEVARRLQGCLRSADTVARLGGDEFVVILPGLLGGEAEVSAIVDKLRAALVQPMHLAERALHITASFGISICPEHGDDAATLMRNADIAMYHAKDGGRNAIQFFTEGMSLAASQSFHIESRLALALKNNELSLRFQPLVDVAAQRVVGLEVLLRWRNSDQYVSPAEFIPVAEETGLILPIGEWVLRQACAQGARWHREYGQPLMIAVNLSPRQFRQPDLVEVIRDILAETGLAADSLELEITESALMDRVDDTRLKLAELSDLGIQLAVDDFGTGYSSLNYLKRFPVDKLKVDQSFVRDLCTDADDAAIVSAIVSLAKNLGLNSLAEGVETAEQLAILKGIGCTLCQGYHFSMPLTADEVARLLGRPAEEQLAFLQSPKAAQAS
ncbi:MAG TPA: EAL domain-containing protein [Rhodocyclaceae bacterium]|nr:EAL domain-containing protein [Rhodocyclaceae bacterium]